MPNPPTTRLGLPAPTLTDPADVPYDLDGLVARLEAITAMFLQGAISTRPAAGTPGRLFWATDEHRIYYDDGQAWSQPSTLPTGSIVATGGTTVFSGWLLCDGRAYSRAEYSALFAAISTVWGSGDGSSTFNVPDLRGRVLVSIDGAGLYNGLLGGAASVQLNAEQLALHTHGAEQDAHTHAASEAGHTHEATQDGHQHWVTDADEGGGTLATGGHGNVWASGAAGGTAKAIQTTNTGAFAIGLNTDYQAPTVHIGYTAPGISVDSRQPAVHVAGAGGNQPHNNMQPFGVGAYIVKT